MGFTGAPGWAQAAADTSFLSGRLPQERRVTFERPCPVAPPIWGSIIDDLWAIDQPPGPASSSAARKWMLLAEAQWDRQNIPVLRGKSVDGEIGGDVQGARIDGHGHWLGTSRERRLLCLAAILWLLGRDVVWVKGVERVVRKLSYCMSFRSSCRSVLGEVYVWMAGHANVRRQPQALSPEA